MVKNDGSQNGARMEPRGESSTALQHNYWWQCYRMEPTRSNGLVTEPKNQDSWQIWLVTHLVYFLWYSGSKEDLREGKKIATVLQGECPSSLPDPVLGPRLLSCLVLPKGTFLSHCLVFWRLLSNQFHPSSLLFSFLLLLSLHHSSSSNVLAKLVDFRWRNRRLQLLLRFDLLTFFRSFIQLCLPTLAATAIRLYQPL